MISRLNGIILEKSPPNIVLDVHGVGYELALPLNDFANLPNLNERVQLFTHLIIREEAHLLFGFLDAHTREAFKLLLKVSGVGAKMALMALSTLSADQLAHAIAHEEVKTLCKISGVGKKTAERMILELRGKFGQAAQPLFAPHSAHQDIALALVALGYAEKELVAVLKSLPPDISVNDGIRLALKQLSTH